MFEIIGNQFHFSEKVEYTVYFIYPHVISGASPEGGVEGLKPLLKFGQV